MSEAEQRIRQLIEAYGEQRFKHGMKVGQEFPDDDPEKIHDPCDAEALSQTAIAIEQELLRAKINTINGAFGVLTFDGVPLTDEQGESLKVWQRQLKAQLKSKKEATNEDR